MTKTPHIIRTRKPYQSFLFRCIIPKDLISVLGQNEFRVSLGNSLYSHSKIISTNLYNLCQFIFREVREGYMQNITLEDVKNILRIEVRKSLLHIHHYQYGTNVFSKDKLKDSISRIEENEEKLRDRLENDYKGTIDLIENEIDKILITQNLEPDKKNVEYKRLVRRWIELKLLRQDWQRDLLNESGKTDKDFRNELEEKWKLGLWERGAEEKPSPIIENDIPKPIQSYVAKSNSPLFSKVYPKHLKQMESNRRRIGTINETRTTYQTLIGILGDKQVGDYTNADARDYRNVLSRLPRNRNKVKKYRNKSLKEILDMDVPIQDRISTTTQNNLLARISSLWNYLLDEYPEYVGTNVFRKKSQQSSSVKLKDKRENFTDDDLKYFGVQQDPKAKRDAQVTVGTQSLSMLLTNIFDNGSHGFDNNYNNSNNHNSNCSITSMEPGKIDVNITFDENN